MSRPTLVSMFHNYANLVHKCRPLTIARDDLPCWGKIGGFPPQGVKPAVITKSTRYFATLKAGDEEQVELSLFISMVSGLSAANSLLSNTFTMHSKDNPLVQFVFHKPLPRGEDSRLASELSGHGLMIEVERRDSDDPRENLVWNHHKIGGYPFFNRNRNSIIEQSKALLQGGYLHLAQFSFPDAQDGPVCGNWPFTAFVFHIFSKDVSGQIDFHYCWG